MFNKLAYSAVALTVSLGTVMSCQAEAMGKDYASAFNQVKQINAGDLNVGYVDIGPKEGQPVILLHGWPYDIHSYAEVAPRWPRKGIVSLCRPCASTAPRALFLIKHRETASLRRWRKISLI